MSLILISFSQIWVVADEETAVIQPDYRYVFENPDILSFDITMSAKAYEEMQPQQRDDEDANTPKRMSARSMFGLNNYLFRLT